MDKQKINEWNEMEKRGTKHTAIGKHQIHTVQPQNTMQQTNLVLSAFHEQ
jgi:hypothetical protein